MCRVSARPRPGPRSDPVVLPAEIEQRAVYHSDQRQRGAVERVSRGDGVGRQDDARPAPDFTPQRIDRRDPHAVLYEGVDAIDGVVGRREGTRDACAVAAPPGAGHHRAHRGPDPRDRGACVRTARGQDDADTEEKVDSQNG